MTGPVPRAEPGDGPVRNSGRGVFALRSGHEQVVHCADDSSGLRAIIAIHSTALGPALGGTRFHPYPSEDAALADVLDLSRGMSYKNALAGLDHGGGKAVIIGDPLLDKSEALLRAYGRFVASLGGRYVTACDVGTYVADMDMVARECRWVTGRSESDGGAGDSSVLTAWGVFQGMRAAAEAVWGAPSLRGKRVGVAGVGKVGRHLAGHLLEDGAAVVVSDVDATALDMVRTAHPEVEVVTDTATLVASSLDVYAPCALGGAVDDRVVDVLRARVVCGGANNQLAHPGVEGRLDAAGILYVPDFVVNSGGVIQVADELRGFSFERAQRRASAIFDTTRRVLALGAESGQTPVAAAERLAEERMSQGVRRRSFWLAPDGQRQPPPPGSGS